VDVTRGLRRSRLVVERDGPPVSVDGRQTRPSGLRLRAGRSLSHEASRLRAINDDGIVSAAATQRLEQHLVVRHADSITPAYDTIAVVQSA